MDFESVDTDMENAVWNETPETNYFKMMMEDNQKGRVRNNENMDDSVAGGETLASVINGGTNKDNNDTRNGVDGNTDANTIDSYSILKDTAPLPNETMSIVGVEDDISTIANDTVNETTKAFFSGHDGRVDSKPRIRLFKEYKTPEKKLKNNSKDNPGSNTDDDDDTVPETPPGMIRVPGKDSSSSYRKDEGIVKSSSIKEASSPIRSKRVYIIAGVLALVLFASIIALSVALNGMRGDGDDNTSTSSINSIIEDGNDANTIKNDIDNNNNHNNNYNNDNNNGNNILEIWPDLDATNQLDDSLPPVAKPAEEAVNELVNNLTQPLSKETSQPSISVPSLIDSPIDDASSSRPTVNIEAEIIFNDELDILISRGVVTTAEEIVMNPNTPQYRATVWLSQDPAYYYYSEDRVIQRWVLAVFAYSWVASSHLETQQRQRRLDGLPQGWLTYTDECTWFTSSIEIAPCDENGMYRRIDIQDMMLGGYLPSELSLLSNSLKHIVLDGNGLEGNIPIELSSLSYLESLRLRRNNLTGPINIDFGLILNLEILELGKNKFTGSIPDSLLGLELIELHLDYNLLSSYISGDIGNLDSLVKLSLNDNSLSGRVPSSLADLKNLQVLTLGNNNLTGSLPKDICRFKDMEVLIVDCDAQGCECCTECATTRSPSPRPLPAPTERPSPAPTIKRTDIATMSPITLFTPPPITLPPTASLAVSLSVSPTTPAPTECIDAISVLNDCYEPLVDVEVSLKNCHPDSDDWMGLYLVDANFDSESLQNPNIWSWACGTRNCREAVNEQLIPVSNIHAGNGEWPLELGIYVAVLARNSAQPYTAFAVSEVFIIEETCPSL